MHFVKHVIVGRDGVKEILDDAHVIIDSSLVRRNSNPRTSHASHIIWNNLVDFVPNTSMMTTSVASKRKHRKPRLKHWSMKAETLGDLLFESFIFQVPVVHIHATHWEKFTKDPCWWKRFCICSALITVSFEHESQLKIIQGSYEKIYVGHSPNGYNRYYRSGGFRGLANLTTFDASNCSQIESIEPSAFYHCSKLQSVKVGTMIPPTCGIDAFSELNSYTILTVPKESIEAYKQANEWKNFTNITALN